MASRLPTQLQSLIPPPAEQVQQGRPCQWQGTLTLSFMNTAQGVFQEVYVTAAETDGESRMDLWPRRFNVFMSARRVQHNNVKAWVKRYTPPVCALMPDKLSDPAANAVNQANFSNLCRMLLENQLLAMAPWGMENLPGAGIIIYPTSPSRSLLIGAVFLSLPFPEFAVYQQSGRPNPVMHRTGAMSYFFRNRSHETGPTQTAQPEPQISQIGSTVERNSSDTAERNLTWREWVQWWQDKPRDKPSTSRSQKLSLLFRAN